MASSAEYAVFTEFSPDTKQALPGWNRRVFTDTDVRKGAAIQCDFKSGIVTLAPGAYHVSGLSMVAYFTKDDPSETIVTRSPASAGYCRLRSFDPDAAVDPANSSRAAQQRSPNHLHRQPEHGQPRAQPVRNLLRNRPAGADRAGASIGIEAGADIPAGLRRELEMACVRPDQHPRTVSGCERRRILSCSSGLRAGSLMSDARGPEGTDTSSCRTL